MAEGTGGDKIRINKKADFKEITQFKGQAALYGMIEGAKRNTGALGRKEETRIAKGLMVKVF